jgi:hypothetical protein
MSPRRSRYRLMQVFMLSAHPGNAYYEQYERDHQEDPEGPRRVFAHGDTRQAFSRAPVKETVTARAGVSRSAVLCHADGTLPHMAGDSHRVFNEGSSTGHDRRRSTNDRRPRCSRRANRRRFCDYCSLPAAGAATADTTAGAGRAVGRWNAYTNCLNSGCRKSAPNLKRFISANACAAVQRSDVMR